MDILSIRPLAALAALPLFSVACDTTPLTRPINEPSLALAHTLDEASSDWDIPVELLAAIAETESGFQDLSSHEEFEGRPARVGLMGIPEVYLADGAALAGVSVYDARHNAPSNIAAAAALLDTWAVDIDRQDIAAWAPIIAEYSQLPEEDAAFYVHDEVYARIATGVHIEDLTTAPWVGEPSFDPPDASYRSGAERPYAVWRGSPNSSARPAGSAGVPSMVVIHTCEGSYTGCWSWLRNGSSGVSAHYVVNSDGSEITQLVQESRKAWHVGARYDCGNNSGQDCARNGQSANDFTIGVEHAGYASQSQWSAGLLDASTQLVCDVTRTHGIPRDSYHIVGHGQLQPYNRVDPGANWPWPAYIAEVRQRCGDGGTAGSSGGGAPAQAQAAPTSSGSPIIIDSNNARNTPGRSRVEVSGAWASSANVRGYYGTGYWWRATGASNDPARFQVLLDAPGCFAIDAWWPAGSDRTTAAPFVISDASNREVGRVTRNQRVNGGRWNALGTFSLTAGWNTVALSRWTQAAGVVVADAVRVTPSTDCPIASAGASSPPPVVTGPINRIIDSNNSRNDVATHSVAYSSAWRSSAATPGYYGTDYLWHHTTTTSDPLRFRFRLDAPARIRVEARWTAGPNRSGEAPFLFFNSREERVGSTTVDQRANHAAWVTLGTYDFTEGWNEVALSHWTPSGYVVVADAVRITEVP